MTLTHVLETLGEVLGAPVATNRVEKQAGDVSHTFADATRARTELGWAPTVALREGLARQAEWHRSLGD